MGLYGAETPEDQQDLEVSRFGEIVKEISPADTLTPADRYQELFVAVQTEKVFEDSKTFVDCVPRHHPERIMEAYRTSFFNPGFDLKAFVHEHFTEEEVPPHCFESDPDRPLAEHIDALWPVLTRHPKEHPALSSLMPLPYDYVVPGGRFSELYYWDSFFTMLGFHGGNHDDLLQAMADNFAYLLDTVGYIPNGNRTYYLSRSQPPVFALMVELFEGEGVRKASDYLPQLRKEYAYWMDGGEVLRPGECHRRCVCLEEGLWLNRYWDDRDSPREESYREDIHTAQQSDRPAHHVYRDLRAGAESGWDFSSRWLGKHNDLSTIRTTSILPVDLNSLLYKLEFMIARLGEAKGEKLTAEDFYQRAKKRQAAMNKYFWNDKEGAYFDYDWRLEQQRPNLTAATVVPLFVQSASTEQAQKVADVIEKRLLAEGGIATTVVEDSGEQWDKPNGWAPLHWMAVQGLNNYQHEDLAATIRQRWLKVVSEIYCREAKLVEKYVLRDTTEHATGGEYPLQDGFGWTNGVTFRLLKEDPDHQANVCRAGAPSS